MANTVQFEYKFLKKTVAYLGQHGLVLWLCLCPNLGYGTGSIATDLVQQQIQRPGSALSGSKDVDANWHTLEQLYQHPQLSNLPTGSQVFIHLQKHPKLNSEQCPLPLFKLSPGQKLWGKAIAQAQCPGFSQALFFVTLHVDVMTPVLVASQALAKGVAIQDTDIAVAMRNITQLKNGYLHNPKQLVQKKTTQHLASGTVIEPRYVEGPRLIKQGDKVQIKMQGQGFAVEAQGVALDNAGLGDTVRVRTPQGRVLRTQAIAFMVVELPL